MKSKPEKKKPRVWKGTYYISLPFAKRKRPHLCKFRYFEDIPVSVVATEILPKKKGAKRVK